MTSSTPTPRTKSRSDRAEDVKAAVAQLPKLLRAAQAAEKQLGADHSTTLSAWEAVEQAGAIAHRQARLLAGKSRAG